MAHTTPARALIAMTLILAGLLAAAGLVRSVMVAWPSPVSARPALQPTPAVESLRVPPGFQVALFASGLGAARFMAFGPSGELYVTSRDPGSVYRLRDTDLDGVADESTVLVSGLNRPHGITYHQGWLYVAETGRVIRVLDADGDGSVDRQETVIRELPTGGGHFTRTIEFGPDGNLYVSVGSSCNVCIEADSRRAAMLRFDADGSNGRIFASGLRNSVGFVFHPETGEIWATDNGRDQLGDDYPPDEINIVRDGRHYGWPYCHANREPDPDYGARPFCPTTEPPIFQIQAHSAALGLAFYTGSNFPADYAGDLFVAYHGSWNRSIPTGYKVVRIHVENGLPTGVEDFLEGFHDGTRAWGRPVQPLVGPDGALYVSDDAAGAVYRIVYTGP